MSLPRFVRNIIQGRRRKVLYVSSAITTVSSDKSIDAYDYFAALIAEISIILHAKFKSHDLVVKVPQGGTKAAENQIEIMNFVLNHIDEYDGIILSPVDRGKLVDTVKKFINMGIPIINIDQGYNNNEFKKIFDNKIPRPPFVQANWEQGGRIAAESLSNYFHSKNLKKPSILLVEGNVGSDQRIKGFREYFQNHKLIKPAYSAINGNYTKVDASQSFAKFLLTNKKIDAIFSTNDEMALGVREVLLSKKSEFESNPPQIVGFDGIKDLTSLIDSGDDFIYDTVDVQLREQLNKLQIIVENIILTKNGEINKSEHYILQDCISYKQKIS